MLYRFDWKQYINGYPDLINMNEGDAIYHWETYGKKENRKIKIPFNSVKYLANSALLQTNFDIIVEKSNIIINLTTIPERLVTNAFLIILEYINNQRLKPKYIIINIYNSEKENNNFLPYLINLSRIHSNIIFNVIVNKSMMKILGLTTDSINISEDDIIICVDDVSMYHHNMTVIYNLCFQLYNCDCVFIKNNIRSNNCYENIIFYDNYQDFVFISLSFAIKYKYVKKLLSFYNKITQLNSNVWKYEDIIIYLFYKIYKLYAVGINCFLHIESEDNKLDNLTLFDGEKSIILSLLASHFCISESLYNAYKNEFIIKLPKKISPRYLLFNINEISYDPTINNFHYLHIDIKYINNTTFMLTLTHYNENMDDYTNITLNHNEYFASTIKLPNNKFSKRCTYFVNIDFPITKINHNNYEFSIMQTNKSIKINQKCFYSILSILCYLPDLNYEYYTNVDIITYISTKYPKLLNIYLKIISGTYRSDLFRMIYLYDNKGIYFDCKMILLHNIEYLLTNNQFAYDYHENSIYNAIIVNTIDKNQIFKNIVLKMIENIKTENYTESKFGITGPYLLGIYIKENINLRSVVLDFWKFSFTVIIKNNHIIIKNIYDGYYDENNNQASYHELWEERRTFNKNINIDENFEL